MLLLKLLHLIYSFSPIIVLIYLFNLHFLDTLFIRFALFFDILVLASFDIEKPISRLP